jgi:hypothetical protein
VGSGASIAALPSAAPHLSNCDVLPLLLLLLLLLRMLLPSADGEGFQGR